MSDSISPSRRSTGSSLVHETGGLTRGTLLATLLAAASESAPRAAGIAAR